MADGTDVTGWNRADILKQAAELIKLDPKHKLEFNNTKEEAVAMVIYVTLDKDGENISQDGGVMFPDDMIVTGQYAERQGIWLFSMPEIIYVNNAQVEYIRKKKKKKR